MCTRSSKSWLSILPDPITLLYNGEWSWLEDGLSLPTGVEQQQRLLSATGHGCGGHLQLMAGQLPGQGPQLHHTGVQHRGKLGLAVACATNTTLAWLPVEGSGCSSETDMLLWEHPGQESITQTDMASYQLSC